jgi:hypothetical protein
MGSMESLLSRNSRGNGCLVRLFAAEEKVSLGTEISLSVVLAPGPGEERLDPLVKAFAGDVGADLRRVLGGVAARCVG